MLSDPLVVWLTGRGKAVVYRERIVCTAICLVWIDSRYRQR